MPFDGLPACLPAWPQVSLHICKASSPDGFLYNSATLDCYYLCQKVWAPTGWFGELFARIVLHYCPAPIGLYKFGLSLVCWVAGRRTRGFGFIRRV